MDVEGWRFSVQGLSVVMANTGMDVSWGRVTKAFEIIPVKGKPVKVRAAAAASQCTGCPSGVGVLYTYCLHAAPPPETSRNLRAHAAGSCAWMQVYDQRMVSAAGLQHHAQRDAAGGTGTGAGLLARPAPRDCDGAGAQPRSAQSLPHFPALDTVLFPTVRPCLQTWPSAWKSCTAKVSRSAPGI